MPDDTPDTPETPQPILCDVSAAQPTSLNHLIGQQVIKNQVNLELEAAFADRRPFCPALLVGPPGMGKTTLASILAHEMALTDGFHEVLGQSIRTVSDLHMLLLNAREKHIVHIDEAHQLDKTMQTALYLSLDKSCILASAGKAKVRMRLEKFTLLLSTTDEYCLLQPLRDRMRLTLRFLYLTVDELVETAKQRAKALNWTVDEQVLPLIAERAKGTPRLALRLLQSSHRVARASGETAITMDHFVRACEAEQIDALGLGPVEKQYLHILDSGPVRLNVISSVLGLPAKTISDVIEPFLLRAELIGKDDTSRRVLTPKGREHIHHTGSGT